MPSVPKPQRKVDRQLLDGSHSRSCIICNHYTSDPAHGKTRGSGGEDSKENVFDFCRRHHTEQGQIGWKLMSRKYPAVHMAITIKGLKIDEVTNRLVVA